jgi:signal transduction histidine kinase
VLKAMMNRYPHGRIFNYTQDGSLSDDSSTSAGTQGREDSGKRPRRRHKQDADDLSKALGGARSIIFLPLWDTHKTRWLSGVFVWTNTPKRVFTAENELAYLRAFSNSVMAEVHRLDVELAEKANKDLVTSISHELRSPLHGILGTAEILSDTAMNALQQGMVHTIESCSRTLLDTINHLLDFTYIDKFKQDPKLKKKHRRSTVSEV